VLFKNAFKNHQPGLMAKDFIKYIGPGFLVTVGFIDPGNWAANVASGSIFGYKLIWVVTLGTIMLILLQHNAAHLGIVTGLCLAEACTTFLPNIVSKAILSTAYLASISTAIAEILGSAIALQMLCGLPLKLGVILTTFLVLWLLVTNSYRKIERLIIGFVSLVGFSFMIELWLINTNWAATVQGTFIPNLPQGSMFIIMSVLGAVVMPHNLFLHSEVIQSRQWNLEEEAVIQKQLKYEFMDTLFSMLIGWVINSAMIIVAAGTFFRYGIQVDQLEQAQSMLKPILGNMAAVVFAVGLLLAGIASSITAGMAGGSIFAGFFREPYDMKDGHTKLGVISIFVIAAILLFLVTDTFKALLISQMLLSIQLPITIFLEIYLTSKKKIMGKYANTRLEKLLLLSTALIVTILNIYLLLDFIK
jgi:manganese transport protein